MKIPMPLPPLTLPSSSVVRYTLPEGGIAELDKSFNTRELVDHLHAQGLHLTGRAICDAGSICYITRRLH